MKAAAAAAAIVAIAIASGGVRAQQPEARGRSAETSTPRLRPLEHGIVPYFIAEGDGGSHHRSEDDELVAWALQEWQRSAGGAVLFSRVSDEDAALVRVHWLPFSPDGELGRMAPSDLGGRTIRSLLIRPDEENFRPSIRRRVRQDPLMRDVVLYFVSLHEIGHALGLSHSADLRDVMWSGASGVTLPIYERYRKRLQSRASIPQVSWLSAHDVARLRRLWAR